MEVRLRVTHCNGSSRPREVPLTLREAGIDIGRALTSDLCLEDPERVVSGLHARIQAREGAIWLTDLSRNGTYLNGASDPMPAHRPVELHDGDRFGIGPYEVLVLLGASSSASLAGPRQTVETSTTPASVEESATTVWSFPKPGAVDDGFAATTLLDATQIQRPLADETRSGFPNTLSLDDGPTAVVPALTGTNAQATDAGVHAALHSLLARFEPAALERRLVGILASDQGLSMEDKARCWDGFRAIHAQLVAEAVTDFMQGLDEAVRSR